MINYKDITALIEDLTTAQKRKVNKWQRGDYSFSNHAFKDDEHRTHFELEHADSDQVTPNAEVKMHLSNNGYEISDYKMGLAKDKHGRDVKIGKALEQTKAPASVKKSFVNDAARKTTKHADLHIVISRHPHDVAGMSTDRGWTSCMNMDKGQGMYAAMLEDDIKAGTHVAYLVHKNDHTIQKPVARIALKPYKSPDGHTIIRPEGSTYGTGNDSFSHSVRKWAETHFPLKDGEVYEKNRDIYNDNRDHDDVENTDVHGEYAFNSSAKTFNALVNHPDNYIRQALAGHANKEQLDKLIHDKTSLVRSAVAIRGHKEHLDKLVYDKDSTVRSWVARHGHPEHLDKLVKDDSEDVLRTVAKHNSPKHLDILINHSEPTVVAAVLQHKREKDLVTSITHPSSLVRALVAQYGKHEHYKHLVNDTSPAIRKMVAHHGNKDILDQLVNDNSQSVRAEVARAGHKEHLDKLVHDDHPDVRTMVAHAGNKEHLDILVKDSEPWVRYEVATHGHMDHLNKLSKDRDAFVKASALLRLDQKKLYPEA